MLTDPTHFMKTQGTGREHDFYDPTVLPQSPSLAGSNPKSHGKNTRVLGDFSKQSDEAGNDPELTHTDTGAIIEGQQYMYPTPPSQYYGSPFDSIFTPRPPPPPGTLAKRISSLFDGIATAVGPLENINVNRMAQQVPAIAPNVQIQTGQLMPLAATAPAVIAAPSVPSVAVVSPQQVATVATGNRPVLVGEQVVRNPAGNPSVIARVSPPVVVPTAVGGQIVPPAAVLPMNTLPNTRGPAVVASVIPANGYPQTTIVANRPSTPVGPQTGISSAPRLPLAAVTNHDNRPSAYPQYSPFSARGNNTPSNRVPGSITNSPAGDNIISDVRYGSNNSGGVGSGIVVIDVTNPLGNLDSSQYTLEKCLDMCCSQVSGK
ncbi:hypothetical protein TGDOM2_356590 [Toxoplasma gondii GAB2-2007-GAL-DOM2]|uniref:Uncharacterized protein n=3 Tax=Toxoplasma gondii TaxID=5811 RepID=S7V2S5_TOXGG|nr:hypothetical protein TGGT1_356590 [Toxoplasma gondii GT1]KAF4641760.1 hypothetical protein TGRH88_075710 [Toxoplasma gondii]KFG48542.1 hypothetical protein TGDOM2_356590 [Toxoplasma gondii GAB2-2007-GAL-DOM2]